jgi:hypothetical protein
MVLPGSLKAFESAGHEVRLRRRKAPLKPKAGLSRPRVRAKKEWKSRGSGVREMGEPRYLAALHQFCPR